VKNFIQGRVTDIIDGKSFVLTTQHEKQADNDFIQRHFTVTIADSDSPKITSLSGIIAKLQLEKKLAGQQVQCEIVEQRIRDRVVAQFNLPKQGNLVL